MLQSNGVWNWKLERRNVVVQNWSSYILLYTLKQIAGYQILKFIVKIAGLYHTPCYNMATLATQIHHYIPLESKIPQQHVCGFIFAQYYIHNCTEECKSLYVQCRIGLAGPILTWLVQTSASDFRKPPLLCLFKLKRIILLETL